MGTTFNKAKTTFLIYEIMDETFKNNNAEQLIGKIVKDLNEKPPKDITHTKLVSDVFITSLSDTDVGDISATNSIVGFCMREDKKNIPAKKVEAEMEKWIEKEMKDTGIKDTSEIDQDLMAEARVAIIEGLAVGQHVKESYCGCIIDLEKKRVYIEKKGYISSRIIMYLHEVHGLNLKVWTPFKAKKENVKDLFLSWLYLAIENERKEISTENYGERIHLTNSIKVSDADNSISLKGNIVKFIEVYKKFLNGAKVEEVNVILNLPSGEKLSYTLKRGDNYIYNIGSSSEKFRHSNERLLVSSRARFFSEYEEHLSSLVNFFETKVL